MSGATLCRSLDPELRNVPARSVLNLLVDEASAVESLERACWRLDSIVDVLEQQRPTNAGRVQDRLNASDGEGSQKLGRDRAGPRHEELVHLKVGIPPSAEGWQGRHVREQVPFTEGDACPSPTPGRYVLDSHRGGPYRFRSKQSNFPPEDVDVGERPRYCSLIMASVTVSRQARQLVTQVRETRLPEPSHCRRIREAAGVSLRQAASVVGVSPATLMRWESGENRPRLKHATAYRQLLDALREAIVE